jgi:hypothetical protein
MAGTKNTQIVIDTFVNQKGLQDGLKKSGEVIKNFTKDAEKELIGLDKVMGKMAGGPVAWGKAAIDMGKQAVAALNEMSAVFREQEQAEVALQNAARNNPYLNDRNVRQLKTFADEMQRTTGIDNVQILQTETRLASLGRNQQQIQNIIKTATDLSVAGVMGFDEAISELNNSLNGTVHTSGQLYPELKNLSKEALASGQAIDIIAGKVAGSAAEAMKTGMGSVKAYQNALDDMKKYIGEGWEKATAPARNWITNLLNSINGTLANKKLLEEAKEAIAKPSEENASLLKQEQALLEKITKEYEKKAVEARKAIELRRADGEELSIQAAELSAQMKEIKDRIKAINDETARQNEVTQENLFLQLDTLSKLTAARKANYEYAVRNAAAFRMTLEQIEEAYEKPSDNIIAQQEKVLDIQSRILQKIYDEQAEYAEKIAELRDTANEKLEEEIRLIREKSTGNEAEIEILNVRIAAETSLLETTKQRIDTEKTSNEERNEAAKKIIEENQKALDEEIEKIKRKAKLEGKSLEDISVRKQILDVETNAYENLLVAAKDYLDLVDDETILNNLKAQWEEYRKLEISENNRKNRLAELAKLQEETQSRLTKILEDVKAEGDKLIDTAQQQTYEDELLAIRKKSVVEAVQFEADYRKSGIDIERESTLREFDDKYNLAVEHLEKRRELELSQLAEGSREQLEAKKRYQEEMKALENQYHDERGQLENETKLNADLQKRQIDKETAKAMEEAYKEAYQKMIGHAQEFINAASSIASSIYKMWKDSIDSQLEEDLKANNAKEQSDEERAAAEKKLMINAANERYKAELFAYSANVIIATAQAAQMTMKGFLDGGWPGAIAAGIIGTIQAAIVASARPQPPSFHTGGVVSGRSGQEVPAVLMSGETVTTGKQFQNVMEAFANVANMKNGGGQPQMNVKVINNAANDVSASQQMTAEGLEIVVTKIVEKSLGNGSLSTGLLAENSYTRGVSLG